MIVCSTYNIDLGGKVVKNLILRILFSSLNRSLDEDHHVNLNLIKYFAIDSMPRSLITIIN